MNKYWSFVHSSPYTPGAFACAFFGSIFLILSQFYNPYFVIWMMVVASAFVLVCVMNEGPNNEVIERCIFVRQAAAAIFLLNSMLFLAIICLPEEFGVPAIDQMGGVQQSFLTIGAMVSLVWAALIQLAYLVSRRERERMIAQSAITRDDDREVIEERHPIST